MYDNLFVDDGGQIGASNWNRDLESARNASGPFGVPDPDPLTMNLSTALINRNKADTLRQELQNIIDTTHQDPWDALPINSLITLLKQKVYSYAVFIAELQKKEIPTKPVEETPILEETETPVETPAKNDNMTLLLIAGGLGALYFISRNKGKKKVAGKDDQVLMIGLGLGALILLSKKKDQAPTEQPQTTT